MKLSIVIPVFHEERNIKETLLKIQKNVKTEHEILVVYDLENDPTIPVVKRFIKSNKKASVILTRNSIGNSQGVMNAIKTGFKKAKGDAIVILMADLSDDVSQIDTMYELFTKGKDIVCASRYMKGGQKIGGPFIKTLLSKLAGLSLFYLFHIPTHDATNAFKLYNRKIFKDIVVESTGGFEYSLEIILKAHRKHYVITEIPTIWKDRMEGQSNFKILAWIPEYIKWYIGFLNKPVILIPLLTIFSLVSFWRILSFNFFQDDYQFLWYALFHPLNHFITFRHPGTPLEALVFTYIFGLNPLPWEIIGIVIKVTAAYLTGIFLYRITYSKLAGILAGVFFASSYAGLYAIDAFNYHVPALASIFILLSLIYLVKSVQINTKDFILFITFFLFATFLDPARVLPTIIFIPLFILLFQKSKNFGTVKKYLIKSFIVFIIIGVPLTLLWYTKATTNVSSQLEIFLRGMITKPSFMITKTKDIGNYFATISNMFFDPIYGLSVNPPKYETANYLRLFGLLGFSLFALWIVGLIYFLRKKIVTIGILSLFLFWTFLFYLPNFLQEPRAPMTSINHYLFISSIGYICFIAYLLSRVSKRWITITIAILFIVINIYKSNVFLYQQLPFRSASLAQNAWNTILQSVQQSRKGQVFLFVGNSYWAGYSIMSFGPYHFLLSRNDPRQEDLPVFTTDEKFVVDLLCSSRVTLSQIYTWNVVTPGKLINVSNTQREGLLRELNNCNTF